jgi:hypothetical protein
VKRLESLGTVRGLAGFWLVGFGVVLPVWWLALVGGGLVFWALWDVARLERVAK